MPTRHTVRVEINPAADLAYVRLSDARVYKTVGLTDDINLDMDEFDMVVGIEVLDLDAEMPFSALVEDHHIPSPTVEMLRLMRPSLSAFHGRVVADQQNSAVNRGVEAISSP